MLHQLLEKRGEGSVRFVKVMGHAKEKHVLSGEVSALDKWGNDAADTLAVEGAQAHAIHEHVRRAAARRKTQAKATHRMMLRILHGMSTTMRLTGEHTDEHDDEAGDDPWSLQCHMQVPHPRSGDG